MKAGKVPIKNESKPAAGVRAMRERLARENPRFRAAVDIESEAEQFCREVRNSLRERRQELELDQSVVATQLEMTQSAVSKVEIGTGDIGMKTVFRFAHALGLRPVCVFVPSAEQLAKNAPMPAAPLLTVEGSASALEEVQIKLVRSVSDSMASVMSRLALKENS